MGMMVTVVALLAACATGTECPVDPIGSATTAARQQVWDRYILEPGDTLTIDQGWLLVDEKLVQSFTVEDVLYRLARKCPEDLRTSLISLYFSADEREIIRETMEMMSPLFSRCGPPPLLGISKVNAATSSRACRSIGGMALDVRPSLVLITRDNDDLKSRFPDAPVKLEPREPGERTLSGLGEDRFRVKLIHELAHAITDWLDVRTCVLRGEDDRNEVLIDFMRIAGWKRLDDPVKTDYGRWTWFELREQPGHKAPTTYASMHPHEDLAESITLYFIDPDYLRERSQARYDFVRSLIGSTASGM